MIFFIVGTDTGIGKTVATGILAWAFKEAGYRVITQKPVQTGALEPEDLLLHRLLMGNPPDPPELLALTCPYLFRYPAAPELAARLEGQRLDLLHLKHCLEELEHRYDVVLVEGAGGLLVPFTPEETFLDFMSLFLGPVIVVSAARLGTINHTLLTLQALRARSFVVSGLVYNRYFATDDFLADQSLADIKRFGQVEHILELPAFDVPYPHPDILSQTQFFIERLFIEKEPGKLS